MNSQNSVDLEQEISALAFEYWQEEGCPENRSVQNWERAEREVRRRRGLSDADGHSPGGIPDDTGASGKMG